MLARDGVQIQLCAFEVLPPGLSNLPFTLDRDGVRSPTVCVCGSALRDLKSSLCSPGTEFEIPLCAFEARRWGISNFLYAYQGRSLRFHCGSLRFDLSESQTRLVLSRDRI